MNKILFGGGFDPIHLGHLNMAIEASKALDADVIFIPAIVSVWKDNSGASFNNRVNMIKMVIKDNPRFFISLFESTTQKKQNYSYLTVRYYKNIYPKDKLYFLIGGDQVNEFHRWKNALEISQKVQIIYFERPGQVINKENVSKYQMKRIDGSPIDISSTNIKKLSGIDSLPKTIWPYIRDHHLYYAKTLANLLDEHRYIHSFSVAQLAYDIAVSNKIAHPEKAYIAGLLHDIAKCIEKEQAHRLMEEFNKEYADMPSWSYHQFLSVQLAKEHFDIDDEEIIDAIKYHATGKAGMSTLGKIIYAADKIDPERKYDSSDMIDACLRNIDAGFVYVLEENKKYLTSKGNDCSNRLTRQCFDFYLK